MTIFANNICNLRQSLRYFSLIILAGLSLATDFDAQESSVYFNRTVKLQPFRNDIAQPFEKPKTLVLTSSDNKWNNHFLNPIKINMESEDIPVVFSKDIYQFEPSSDLRDYISIEQR